MSRYVLMTLVAISTFFMQHKNAVSDVVYSIDSFGLTRDSDSSPVSITGGLIRTTDLAADDGLLDVSEILEMTIYHDLLPGGSISETDQSLMGSGLTVVGNELRGSFGFSEQVFLQWVSFNANDGLVTMGVSDDGSNFEYATGSFSSPYRVGASAIPEPSSALCIGLLLIGVVRIRRRVSTNKSSL